VRKQLFPAKLILRNFKIPKLGNIVQTYPTVDKVSNILGGGPAGIPIIEEDGKCRRQLPELRVRLEQAAVEFKDIAEHPEGHEMVYCRLELDENIEVDLRPGIQGDPPDEVQLKLLFRRGDEGLIHEGCLGEIEVRNPWFGHTGEEEFLEDLWLGEEVFVAVIVGMGYRKRVAWNQYWRKSRVKAGNSTQAQVVGVAENRCRRAATFGARGSRGITGSIPWVVSGRGIKE